MSPRHANLCLILLATVLAFKALPAAADEGMEWQLTKSNDPDNKAAMPARLVYGVPETDNVQVTGVCDARPSTGAKFSSVTFGTDIGDLANGADADLRFSGGGIEQTLHGNIQRAEGEGVSGVHLDVANDDPIWTVFADKDTLDYQVPATARPRSTSRVAETSSIVCRSLPDLRDSGSRRRRRRRDDLASNSEEKEASIAPRNSAPSPPSRRFWRTILPASLPTSPTPISTSSARPPHLRRRLRRRRLPRPHQRQSPAIPRPISRNCSK